MIAEILNQPVPSIVIPNAWQYLFTVTGAGAIFVAAWWMFCIAVRNGIDGSKAILRAIKRKQPGVIKQVLLGGWKPLPDYDPVRAHPEQQDWISL